MSLPLTSPITLTRLFVGPTRVYLAFPLTNLSSHHHLSPTPRLASPSTPCGFIGSTVWSSGDRPLQSLRRRRDRRRCFVLPLFTLPDRISPKVCAATALEAPASSLAQFQVASTRVVPVRPSHSLIIGARAPPFLPPPPPPFPNPKLQFKLILRNPTHDPCSKVQASAKSYQSEGR
jgi:hypothetical protein